MCGIVGALGSPGRVQEDIFRKMVAAICHRGPDDQGYQQMNGGDAEVWLGSTRLAIIDLSSAGHQPMHDPETGNWIAYNGEVYNFQEVRQELENRGQRFRSRTDTEVVLKAYEVLGPECLQKLRGMFAFAIWNSRKRELFAARDRLGKKPLYFCRTPGGVFLLASEVRALLASGLVDRKLDPASLEVFLANGFLVAPQTTIAGVRSLLPGHFMRVGSDGQILETSAYWRIPARGEVHASNGFLEETRERMEEAVGLRLISDVPLGAFLSGGLDSSTVVALMKKAGGDVRTFAVTFSEAAYDESRYSRHVAQRFGTQHTEVCLDKKEFYALVPAALAAMDQPSFDGVNTYCVSQAARRSGLKVALSGLGADELFGGYAFFHSVPLLARTRPWVGPARMAARAFRSRLERDPLSGLAGFKKTADLLLQTTGTESRAEFLIASFQCAVALFPSWARRQLCTQDAHVPAASGRFGIPREFLAFLLEETEGEALPDGLSRLALRLFLGERCLRDTDTMSMGVSLEVRAPFTDHVLVESLSQCPAATRCEGPPDKPFMQKVVRPLLGEDYPWRRKQGFIFPFHEWLRGADAFRDLTAGLATPSACAGAGLNGNLVSQLFSQYQAGNTEVPWSRVWAVAVFLDWCRRHRVSQ